MSLHRPALAPRATSYPAPTASIATGLRRKFLETGDLLHAQNQESSLPRIPRRKLLVPSTLDSTVVSEGVVVPGPDIQWNPNYDTFLKRMEILAKSALKRDSTVPDGWPKEVREPWAWSGSAFTGVEQERKYIIALSVADIAEVETALEKFKKTGGGPGDVSRTTFQLPGLASRLEDVARNLHNGFGFNVIRGVDPRRYSALDNVLIYLGITSYIAPYRGVQDSGGSMIIHIKDLGGIIPDSEMRQSPYARNAQPFHNDVCDILAMYVQETAADGGESYLSSAAQIYNEIAATRPDVIHTLAKNDWIFDKHRTPAVWNTRALLFNFKGKGPGFCFSRRPITGSPTSPRSPGVPPMTEAQAEALDMVHFVGVKHQLSMTLQRGDIQLINNLAIFHARNGFRDSASKRRHIIRLWLRNEELAWETPQGLQKTWFEKYGDSERRKIAKWNVAPGTTRERVLYRSDSCS